MTHTVVVFQFLYTKGVNRSIYKILSRHWSVLCPLTFVIQNDEAAGLAVGEASQQSEQKKVCVIKSL